MTTGVTKRDWKSECRELENETARLKRELAMRTQLHQAAMEGRAVLSQHLAESQAREAKLREVYRKMCNAAAGYSNCCEDSASVRRCEREYEEAEAMYRAIK